ncbi:MAG: hypothetical protein JJ896_02190 [Rhodothermales bacterium]|nr:hypothetical protein [Rhodothermales bacterium]MBO6778439.1 hypothetical protein [Rhodothermales bacterium]
MDLLPDWAPNFHPLVLHFPIALLFGAASMDLIGLVTRDRGSFRRIADWMYGIGAVAAVATWYTGTLAADSVFLPTEANAVLTEHADLGKYTMWFFGGYALLRGATAFSAASAKAVFRIGFFVVGVAGLLLLTHTATHGAELVFRYGVGVEAVENRPATPVIQQTEGSSGVELTDTGVLWLPATAGGWLDDVEFVEGSREGLRSALVDAGELGDVLELSADEPTLFLFEPTIDRLQVDMKVDLSEFDGSLLVSHHVQEDGSYGFTSLGGGTMRLGRTENADLLVQATEAQETPGWQDIRVVVDGTHFRSYVDTEMRIHGHGGAFEPGRVGLRINGSGPVRVAVFQAVDLAAATSGGAAADSAEPAEETAADEHQH